LATTSFSTYSWRCEPLRASSATMPSRGLNPAASPGVTG
jgi:hypothetical protein